MELSWIQRHTLLILLRTKSARVKDLIPPGVAANLFSYHLDGLVTKKMIEKTSRGTYDLTTKGQKIAGKFSTATNEFTEDIKAVVMLVGKTGDKQLLFRWSRQPYLGQVTPLYDRVPFGKDLHEGVASVLYDKLGQSVPVEFLTSALVKIIHEDQVISHMNALVYRIDLTGVDVPFTSRNGETLLRSVDDSQLMSGVSDFLHKIEVSGEPFQTEWRY